MLRKNETKIRNYFSPVHSQNVTLVSFSGLNPYERDVVENIDTQMGDLIILVGIIHGFKTNKTCKQLICLLFKIDLTQLQLLHTLQC